MSAVCQTESAAQLMVRISSKDRPTLVNLSPEIIPQDGPCAKDIIEIRGDTNVGKSIHLMELLALAVLPHKFGGKEASAIVIDTNSNFHVPNLLARILEKHILHHSISTATTNETEDLRAVTSDTEQIVFDALKNIQIFKCYRNQDYDSALQQTKRLLVENSKISLIAIDSLTTFYWTSTTKSQTIRMSSFLHQKLIELKRISDEYRTILVYTRPKYFGGRSQLDEVSYCIELREKLDSELFEARIHDKRNELNSSRNYEINDFGIRWMSSSDNERRKV